MNDRYGKLILGSGKWVPEDVSAYQYVVYGCQTW